MNKKINKSPISPGSGIAWPLMILLLVLFSHGRAIGQLALPDVVCVGSTKRYWVDPTQGSTYVWKINGVVQPVATHEIFITWNGALGSTGSPHTLSVQETSILGCEGLVISGFVYVNPPLPVSVSITASQNPACSGSPVTFTASVINGGTAPLYSWKVNGNPSGASSGTFTYLPASGDLVTCEISSNAVCVTNNPVVSAPVAMQIAPSPNVVFTPCFDVVTSTEAKPFKLRGGLPLGGTYSGNGVNPPTGMFDPATSGTGFIPITYSYSNFYDCPDSAIFNIHVVQVPSFTCGDTLTDIRDSKKYPSVLIGGQCWLSRNLDYGDRLNSDAPQTNNCVNEKYCFSNNPSNCSSHGALYQWDELMKYEDSPGSQGICPPGWHVPTDPEWMELLNFYNGAAFAGKHLQDLTAPGFHALPGGVIYQSNSLSHNNLAVLFWTSTTISPLRVISHGMNNKDISVSYYESLRDNAFPVRCLKD